MSLRVNPNPMPSLLAELAQNLRQENEAALQVSSGRRLNRPSDDPVSVAQLVRNRAQSGAAAQFSSNISSVRGLLQVADSALNSVVTALTRAVSLGVRGANGTLTPENRAAIAEELIGLKEQLRGQANLSYQGNYIFAGTAVTTQPFVDDAGQPSGVRYDGNTGVNDVQITDGQSLPVNVPGSQIFTPPGTAAVAATNTLVTTDLMKENDTVTIGAKTYRFRDAGNVINPNDVLIEATAAATLANLKAAVNLEVAVGKYEATTTINATVSAGAVTAGGTMTFTAKTAGVAGNTLDTTATGVALGWSGGTDLSGGADQTFTDVFLGITHLITALQTGANIPAATSEVQAAFNRVNSQRSFYGGALARLDTASSFLASEKLQLSQQENDLAAADMTYAASALVQAVTARNATLAAAGKLSQLSLLDYLH